MLLGVSGRVVTSPPFGPMQGGVAVNISGPCLRPGDFVKVNFENWGVNCARLNRIRARCVMPMFHKTGLVPIKMSRDGGASFPFIGNFYVCKSFSNQSRYFLILLHKLRVQRSFSATTSSSVASAASRRCSAQAKSLVSAVGRTANNAVAISQLDL